VGFPWDPWAFPYYAHLYSKGPWPQDARRHPFAMYMYANSA